MNRFAVTLVSLASCSFVGTVTAGRVLYAPGNPDDPTLRAQISWFTGEACDYFDPRYSTPTLDQLTPYDMVFTWVNYAYADRDAMGDVLADFVDQGGVVALGQWCLPTATNYLGGRIMDPTGPYLPCTGDSYQYGGSTYSGDGAIWYFDGVDSYFTNYRDNVTVRDGFTSEGTYTDGYPIVTFRDSGTYYRPVFYLPGVLGSYGVGDHARLIANVSMDVPEPATLSLLSLGVLVALRRPR